jgi:malate dehydrogenase (oxaloacetate-decarboxylating)
MDRVYLVDTKGLVTNTRGDKLQAHKVPWARKDIAAADNAKYTTLLDVVKNIKPTALIGLAGVGPAFTQEMVELMCLVTPRPIIFALSNPTSKCEIDAAEGFRWSDGKAIIATGSPFPPTVLDGPSGPRTYRISQGNNMYVFPGLGLGCVMARAKEMSEEVLVKCAATLSEMVSDEDLVRTEGLYPPLQEIRKVSAHIAAAAVLQFQHEKVVSPAIAGSLPTNMEALVKYASDAMWQCQYEGAEYYVRHLRQ